MSLWSQGKEVPSSSSTIQSLQLFVLCSALLQSSMLSFSYAFSLQHINAQISHPENISSLITLIPFLLQPVFQDKWSACGGFLSSWSLANLLECGSSSRPPIGILSPRRSPRIWLPNPVGILSSKVTFLQYSLAKPSFLKHPPPSTSKEVVCLPFPQ